MIPMIIEIAVVIRHMETNTTPIPAKLPPELRILYTKKPMNAKKTSHLKSWFPNIFGFCLSRLILERKMSRNDPLGHKFQHQYLPLKNERTMKNTIIPTTR